MNSGFSSLFILLSHPFILFCFERYSKHYLKAIYSTVLGKPCVAKDEFWGYYMQVMHLSDWVVLSPWSSLFVIHIYILQARAVSTVALFCHVHSAVLQNEAFSSVSCLLFLIPATPHSQLFMSPSALAVFSCSFSKNIHFHSLIIKSFSSDFSPYLAHKWLVLSWTCLPQINNFGILLFISSGFKVILGKCYFILFILLLGNILAHLGLLTRDSNPCPVSLPHCPWQGVFRSTAGNYVTSDSSLRTALLWIVHLLNRRGTYPSAL